MSENKTNETEDSLLPYIHFFLRAFSAALVFAPVTSLAVVL